MPPAPIRMKGTPKKGKSLLSQNSGDCASLKSASPIMVAAIVVQKIAKPRKIPKKIIGTICPRLRGSRRMGRRDAASIIALSQIPPRQVSMADGDENQHQRKGHLGEFQEAEGNARALADPGD